jgi:hypothetical protein
VYEIGRSIESFPDYEDEIFRAFETQPDYVEAAADNGWEPFEDEYGAPCWKKDDDTWAGDAKSICDAFDIDAENYCREVFEHWIVSDWLADRLEEHGEHTLRDFFGLSIWCRTTTGQAIKIDRVICDIHDELHKQRG